MKYGAQKRYISWSHCREKAVGRDMEARVEDTGKGREGKSQVEGRNATSAVERLKFSRTKVSENKRRSSTKMCYPSAFTDSLPFDVPCVTKMAVRTLGYVLYLSEASLRSSL